MANGRIRCEKSPEIASAWLKLTLENGARAFSHSLDQDRTVALDAQCSAKQPFARRFENAPACGAAKSWKALHAATQREVRGQTRTSKLKGMYRPVNGGQAFFP
jgi:hypothetical protein